MFKKNCIKCDGTGYISAFSHVEGGVCFKCGGQKYTLVKTEPEILEKRRAYAAKKRAEKTRLEFEKFISEKEAKLENERLQNNGLTNEELTEKKREERLNEIAIVAKDLLSIMADAKARSAYLGYAEGDLSRGCKIEGITKGYLCKGIAKLSGRANSKAYKNAYDYISNLVDETNKKLEESGLAS